MSKLFVNLLIFAFVGGGFIYFLKSQQDLGAVRVANATQKETIERLERNVIISQNVIKQLHNERLRNDDKKNKIANILRNQPVANFCGGKSYAEIDNKLLGPSARRAINGLYDND